MPKALTDSMIAAILSLTSDTAFSLLSLMALTPAEKLATSLLSLVLASPTTVTVRAGLRLNAPQSTPDQGRKKEPVTNRTAASKKPRKAKRNGRIRIFRIALKTTGMQESTGSVWEGTGD